MKKHLVEIVAIVLAVAFLGYAWYEESNKPEPEPVRLPQSQEQF